MNYDLPWNPMIVEQRIGRVQRLASDFKYVTIFNIALSGTFEDFIVDRLMEKLQMARRASISPIALAHFVPTESERAQDSFVWRIFLSANRCLLRRNMR